MRGKNIIIVILVILVFGLLGYIIYDKVMSNDNGDISKPEPVVNKYSQQDIEKVLEEEGFILYGDSSLLEFDDKEKTYVAFTLYKKDNQEKDIYGTGFTLDDIKKYYEDSIYSEIEVNYTDIYLAPGFNEVYFHLNNGNYTFEPMAAHGTFNVLPVYSKVVDYKAVDNIYNISMQYVFTFYGDSPMDAKLYYTYQDGLSSKNDFYTFNIEDYFSEEKSTYDTDLLNKDINNYINDNYDKIKGNLKTYNYTFKVVNDKLKLTDFKVD